MRRRRGRPDHHRLLRPGGAALHPEVPVVARSWTATGRPSWAGAGAGSWLTFLAVMALLAAAGRSPTPAPTCALVALLALAVAFASASADINVDAYRTELLPGKLLGPGTSLHITGYRLGMVFAGAPGPGPGRPPALAHGLPDHGPGPAARGRGHLPGARARRRRARPGPCGRRWWSRSPNSSRRRRSLEVLAFILLYKLGDNLCVSLNAALPPGPGLQQDRDRPGHQGRGHGLPDRGRPAGGPAHEPLEPAHAPCGCSACCRWSA